MKIDVIEIEISKLSFNQNHPISLRKTPRYYEILESVKERGILEPIKVRPFQNAYEVIDGRWRVEICKELGIGTRHRNYTRNC